MIRNLRYAVAVSAGLIAMPTHAGGEWAPRVIQFLGEAQVNDAAPDLTGWDARIEIDVAVAGRDVPRAISSAESSRTVFATLQRRFEGPTVTPYVGVGAGYAESLVDLPSSVLSDALAFKGVFGTDFSLDEGLGAFLEYNFAVAPGALAEGGTSTTLRSHSISTGLRLNLN